MNRNTKLVELLHTEGVLNTPHILKAFQNVDRRNFVPPAYEEEAYADHALPIGHGQTISQPYTVAFMLALLAPQEGEKILDVGSGSGWTTALLGSIVGNEGEVIGLEIVPELVEMGQDNLLQYPALNARIEAASAGTLGLPDKAPFVRILVSAENTKIPQELVEQLVIGGVMVVPINSAIVKIVKTSGTEYEEERHEGFAFVPLVH